MQVDVRVGELGHPAAAKLIVALDAEIRARYEDPIQGLVLDLGLAEVAPRLGAFALAWAGDDAVGCGAVRLIADDTAELKRMYVVPEYRRHGVASAILQFLESQARSLGASRIVLETVTSPPSARSLYQAFGYEQIDKFGQYVESEISYCMGKILRPE